MQTDVVSGPYVDLQYGLPSFDCFVPTPYYPTYALGTNPITTVNLASTITITDPNASRYKVGDNVLISGAVGFNGFTSGQLNFAYGLSITSIGAGSYVVYTGGVANASGSGGGSSVSVTVRPYNQYWWLTPPTQMRVKGVRVQYAGDPDFYTAFPIDVTDGIGGPIKFTIPLGVWSDFVATNIPGFDFYLLLPGEGILFKNGAYVVPKAYLPSPGNSCIQVIYG
jgi:hypothetical protein